jgi:LCP family protein required for cell wall assembly
MSPSFEDIPKSGLWKRLLLGAMLVVFATASATAVAAFREIDRVVDALEPGQDLQLGNEIAITDPGDPQTIMLIGSDRRPDNATDGGAGTGARSDTIILVRLDPDENATALMSLPRDLKVEIPGHGTDKINAAYDLGGPRLTLKTVKRLTGLSINHVINVDFRGFRRAVDAIGCIYVDVDRRYFNDSPGFAYINIYPGYQKLCGEEALEYARFRYEDSDIVRSARQQDLLREAKQQVGAGQLFKDRDKLIRIFGKYTTSDEELKSRAGVLTLLKLAVGTVEDPIREVHFEGQITDGDEEAGLPSFVEASDATVKRLTAQFLDAGETKGPRGEGRPRREAPAPRPARPRDPDGGLFKSAESGLAQAQGAIDDGAARGGRLPIYYPTVFTEGSTFDDDVPRAYRIRTPGGGVESGYRMVLRGKLVGDYYGIQGTTWKDPPILDGVAEERTVKGRTFELHYDGDRVRLVAWRTDKAVYWVSNTLLQTLTARQMVSIARETELPEPTKPKQRRKAR